MTVVAKYSVVSWYCLQGNAQALQTTVKYRVCCAIFNTGIFRIHRNLKHQSAIFGYRSKVSQTSFRRYVGDKDKNLTHTYVNVQVNSLRGSRVFRTDRQAWWDLKESLLAFCVWTRLKTHFVTADCSNLLFHDSSVLSDLVQQQEATW
jgi:hypothetical protein